MAKVFLTSVLRLVPVWLGLSLITFLLLRITGNPARAALGELATDAAIAEWNEEHGLDRPVIEQYLSYIGGVLQGDLGESYRFRTGIFDLVVERLPATLELGGASLLVSFALGMPLGTLMAVRSESRIDYIGRGLVLAGQAVPNFLVAIVLILLLGVKWHLLPTGGRGSLSQLILPVTVLSIVLMPLTVRVTRATVLEVLDQDFVRTARAKGLREWIVVTRHVLRNASIPIVTVLGVQTSALLSGAIITETIFSWPGIGRLIVTAVIGRDFPLVQGAILIVSTAVVLANMLVDLAYGLLDPRIRMGKRDAA